MKEKDKKIEFEEFEETYDKYDKAIIKDEDYLDDIRLDIERNGLDYIKERGELLSNLIDGIEESLKLNKEFIEVLEKVENRMEFDSDEELIQSYLEFERGKIKDLKLELKETKINYKRVKPLIKEAENNYEEYKSLLDMKKIYH